MRSFILRFIQDVRHREQVILPAENGEEFLLLYGLIQRVRRLAQAYLCLVKSGFANEGTVLIRSALEHSVTAQWAYLIPGGIDRLRVSLARAEADLARGMVGYSSDPEWIAQEKELRDAIPAGRGLPNFTRQGGIIAELDPVSFLAVSYQIFSQVGHVTHRAPVDFIMEDAGGVRLRTTAEPEMGSEMLYALSGFCMLVAWLHARLEADDLEILRLKQISITLHVPWRLDTHLPDVRRRFPDEDPKIN